MNKLSPNIVKIFNKKLKVEVSDDKLEVFLTIPNFKWPKLKSIELLKYFNSYTEFKSEFDQEIFKKAIKERNTKFSIAKGTPAIDGIDGKIEQKYEEANKKAKPKILKSGNADFKELGLIKCVDKNQILFKVTPYITEKHGLDVYGDKIEAREANELPVELLENVKYDRKDQTIKANISGFPLFDGEKINVSNTVEIEQDIDLSIGNIDVPCNLTIHGSVKEGFSIKAQGDIVITNCIENATVECSGNLTIKGNVNNHYKGSVFCNQDFHGKSLNHAKLIINGNCKIDKESMFSDIYCQGNIECKGVLIGGKVTSQKGDITIYELGSKMEAAKTEIKIYPTDELFEKINEYTNIVINAQKEYEKAETEKQEIEDYLCQPGITAKEFSEFEKIFEEFVKKQKILSNKIIVDKKSLQSAKDELKKINPGTLNIKKIIYPGVKIKIAGLFYLVRHEERRISFFSNDKKIDTKML